MAYYDDCDCDAGYGQNRSIFCAQVQEQEAHGEEVLDYSRSAIPEVMSLGIE